MSSTPSPLTRLEIQARGENRNSWGDTKLNEALKRLEEAIADNVQIALSGTSRTLTSANYVADEARAAVLTFTGSPGGTCTITTPDSEKMYVVDNQTDQALSFVRSSGGAAATVRAGTKIIVYCSGSSWTAVDMSLDKIKPPAAAVSMAGNKITNLGTPTVSTDAATKAYADAIGAATADNATIAVNAAAAAVISAANALTSEQNAAASALAAAAQLARLSGTSTTSNTIGLGTKSFTTQTNKLFDGQYVMIVSAADHANFMFGVATYSGTSLSVAVELTGGFGTKTDWIISVSGPRGVQGPSGTSTMPYLPKTATFAPGPTDNGSFFDCTAGTFSVTPVAAATIGANWSIYIRNSGTGSITLDPNGAETIDGLTSYIMYPAETRLIMCDGSTFRSVVMTAFHMDFLASGTFTKPPGYNRFGGQAWGSGGGGGKAPSGGNATGGGGGMCLPFDLRASLVGASETVTIGAGGIGPTALDSFGGAGNPTTFGSLVTAHPGGRGGKTTSGVQYYGATGGGSDGPGQSGGGSLQAGGAPAILSSSTAYTNGFGGQSNLLEGVLFGGGAGGNVSNGNVAAAAGNVTKGGGGGGSAGISGVSAGGTSIEGGNGGAGTSSTSGGNGAQPGGGGGATLTGTKAGDGGAGKLTIWGLV